MEACIKSLCNETFSLKLMMLFGAVLLIVAPRRRSLPGLDLKFSLGIEKEEGNKMKSGTKKREN